MKLLVGLGNPGGQYEGNRHNIGFMALDAIARAHGITQFRSKHGGLLAEGNIGGEKVILLKPQTFMNRSGDSVQQVAQFYKIAPADIIVLYDELDLAPGKVRVKVGGGNGGHNGLRSIDPQIGTGYKRVRLGIGHPGKEFVTHHVLGDFAKADSDWVTPLLDAVGKHAGMLLAGNRVERHEADIVAIAFILAARIAEADKQFHHSTPENERGGPKAAPNYSRTKR